MSNETVPQKVPRDVTLAVSKAVYSYGGSLGDLAEQTLLRVSDALAPYYPMTEDEDSAAVTLREWLTARQVGDDAAGALKRLENLAEAGVREWRQVMDRLFHDSEYRRERRYREEYHPEMHQEILYKELSHELKSGDPMAFVAAVERIVDVALRRNAPLPIGAPPQVHVTGEMVAVAKQVADERQKYLSAYVERVGRAKHALARYVHRIVAAEDIGPEKT